MTQVVFFGSFQHYSAMILASLLAERAHNALSLNVMGVVTTPPMPVGRKQIITKTPVHELAEAHSIPVYTPERLAEPPHLPFGSLPDYFVTAGYGKLLPKAWLAYPCRGALNLHFSLLPKYRGANPAEWAIMGGETETGITLMEMSEGLDRGAIIEQASLPIEADDTRETLYEKLYTLGAERLPEWVSHEAESAGQRTHQPLESPTPYAALLKREDGFIPWTSIKKCMRGETLKIGDFPSVKLQKAAAVNGERETLTAFLSRLPRALAGYPSVWTIVPTVKGDKRMKLLSFTYTPHSVRLTPHTVQLEGQQPALWNQIKNHVD